MTSRAVPATVAAPSDVRTGGSWSPRQRLKNATLRALIRCALWVADRLPAGWLLAAGCALGKIAAVVFPRSRRLAESNIALALPDADRRLLARRVFACAGTNLAISLLLRRNQTRALDWVSIDEAARATFDAALAEGRGAVFVSAHLGPFELLPAAIAELGYWPAVVVRESYDPALDAVVDAHRLARGIRVIHRGRPGAASRIVRSLSANRPVGFLPDLGGRMRCSTVTLLGRTADLPVGAVRIACRARSPLLVGTLAQAPDDRQHGPQRYALRLVRIAARDESRMTHCVMMTLSSAILALPEQWLWMGARLR